MPIPTPTMVILLWADASRRADLDRPLATQEFLDLPPRNRRPEEKRLLPVWVRQEAATRAFDRAERRVADVDRGVAPRSLRPEPPDPGAANGAESGERVLAKEAVEQHAVLRVVPGPRDDAPRAVRRMERAAPHHRTEEAVPLLVWIHEQVTRLNRLLERRLERGR